MKMIRKLLSVVLALAMLLSIAGMALAQTADGTYEGVAQGMGGDVKVSVTVSGGVITDVTVLSGFSILQWQQSSAFAEQFCKSA